jgi:hypothetical protein
MANTQKILNNVGFSYVYDGDERTLFVTLLVAHITHYEIYTEVMAVVLQ